jgi:hypothetical protein
MDYLIEFSERDDVRSLAGRFLEHCEAVQGIAVDLDDLWLASWRLYNTLPTSAFEREMHLLERSYFAWREYRYQPFHALRDEFISFPYGLDVHWRPAFWERFSEWRELRPEPFVMTVVLRSEFTQERMYALREIETGGLQVRFEPRPMARLYSKPKDKVRPLVGGLSVSQPAGGAGTLGGILQDAGGRRFGLTCSHVLATGDEAQQPSPADRPRAAGRIGSCIESFALQSHTPPLDPYDPSINTVDAALIEFDAQVQSKLEVMGVGALAGIASKSHVHPNTSVTVVGKEARCRALYIGAVTLVHEFDFNGHKYGYRNLFELKRASRFHALTGSIRHPVNPGDSGGWVLRAGASGPEWLGVVAAGDGPYGYAIPAEFIVDWIENLSGVGSIQVL